MVAPKAHALAAEHERVNDEVIAFALACSPAQWRAIVPGEEWPVGVVIHHVAVGHDLMLRWLRSVAEGDDITDSVASVDDANAQHARQFAEVSVADTVALSRENGAGVVAFLRGVDDAQLGRSSAFGPGDGMTVTTEQIAAIACRHCSTHLASARHALGTEAPGIDEGALG